MRRRSAIVAVVVTGLALLSASYAARSWLAPESPSLTQPSVVSPTESPRSVSRDGEQPLPTVEPMVESAPRPRAAPPRGPRSPRFGRVIDAQNGVPISGARVGRPQPAPGGLLDREIFSLQSLDDATACDDAGRFEFALADGEWLVVAAEGYAAVPVAAAKVGSMREAAAAVQLARPARLRATVELADGTPAADVDVRVIDRIGDARFVVEAKTDARGEALLTGIAPGRELQIELADGFALLAVDPVTTEFKPGAGIVKKWKLHSNAIVSGRVLDQHGAPVAEAVVENAATISLVQGSEAALALARAREAGWGLQFRWMSGGERTADSDRDGRFLFECPLPCFSIVVVWSLHKGVAERCHGSAASFARVEEGVRSAWVELEVERGLVIRGRLFGPDGLPIAGSVAICASDEVAAFSSTTFATDDEGRFELHGVSSRTALPLVGWSKERHLGSGSPQIARSGGEELRIDLVPLRSVVVVARTHKSARSHRSRTRFQRTGDGRPATSYVERLDDSGLRPSLMAGEAVDEWAIWNGGLRVLGLASGRWDVIVEDEDRGIAVVPGFEVAEAGEQRLQVDVVKGVFVSVAMPFVRGRSAEVRVRIVQRGVVLLDRWHGHVGDGGDALSTWRDGFDRQEVEAIVLPGPLTVEWTIAGRTTQEAFTALAGEMLEIYPPAQ